MLIDTGAETTLLPGSIFSMLGIAGTGQRDQLMASDGSVIEAELS